MSWFSRDKSRPVTSYNGYFVGQRVIINNSEIGTVEKGPDDGSCPFDIWVYSPTRGYACCFSYSSIKPLPNGQV